jgi:hypothetical protein
MRGGGGDRLTIFDEQLSAVEMTLGERDRYHFCFWRFEIDICEPSHTWSHNSFHTESHTIYPQDE